MESLVGFNVPSTEIPPTGSAPDSAVNSVPVAPTTDAAPAPSNPAESDPKGNGDLPSVSRTSENVVPDSSAKAMAEENKSDSFGLKANAAFRRH